MFRWWNCAFISPDTTLEGNSIIFKTLKEGFGGNSTGKKIQHISSGVGLGKSSDSVDLFNNYLLCTYLGDYVKQCRHTINKTECLPSRNFVS